ncbi:MAG TPA: PTS sugar transporter subunit IIB [Gemmatimonadales bacterium]|nr:PTS sugar transporter subunit IIB [Gemmatimonadales bacterium]
MAILLYRVDDRLVHGQVVIGWGKPLGIDFIVLVDDEVRASAWEQEIYRMGVPPEIKLIFYSVAEAASRIPELQASGGRGILLTGDIATMTALRSAGVAIPQVNLGGIHHRPGRTERLPYLYLSDDELRSLKELASSGLEIAAQDVPTRAPVRIGELS